MELLLARLDKAFTVVEDKKAAGAKASKPKGACAPAASRFHLACDTCSPSGRLFSVADVRRGDEEAVDLLFELEQSLPATSKAELGKLIPTLEKLFLDKVRAAAPSCVC
jgi:hypothetical protein